MSIEKVAFLGCGKGLGLAVLKCWQEKYPEHQLLLSSRTIQSKKHPVFKCDFSKPSEVDQLILRLEDFSPQRIFYFAGGGPYGPYAQKKWADHDWALNVTLVTPMKLLNHFLSAPYLKQFITVGSSVAEANADTNAASYSAAKHGLFGLIKTLHGEYPLKDIRLFSPGYMDTDMLPPKALPRMLGKPILPVESVAGAFLDWTIQPEAPWHKLYSSELL